MKNLALFDFDGTITSKDTLLEFIKYYHGGFRFYSGMMYLSPFLVFMKLGLISKQAGKEKVLTYFFKNEKVEKFNKTGSSFSTQFIPKIVRPEALKKIEYHRSAKHEIAIVSASATNWIKDWASMYGIKVIATNLIESSGKITGKIEGGNCNGAEKAVRIKEELDLSAYDEIYAYGDTSGDTEMLALASHPFYRCF